MLKKPSVRPVGRSMAVFMASAVAIGALVAGCGDGGGSTEGTTETSSSAEGGQKGAAAKLVPSDFSSKGEIEVATSADLPPIEYFATDNETITGMDVDVANGIGERLGLKFKFKNYGFDTIIPSLQSGRFDMAMAGMIVTPERTEVIDMIPYFKDSVNFLVKAGEGENFQTLEDICGKTVAVQTASDYAAIAEKQSEECKAAGKPGVNIALLRQQTEANLAVTSGRADASISDAPLNEYAAKQSNGTLEASGKPFGTDYWGIALTKESPLAPAIVAALKEMMADGAYEEILSKWGISSAGPVTPEVAGS